MGIANEKVLDRAFKVIERLKRPTTQADLAKDLGISQSSAVRWMRSASICLPVMEVGTITNKSKRPITVYQLMKG